MTLKHKWYDGLTSRSAFSRINGEVTGFDSPVPHRWSRCRPLGLCLVFLVYCLLCFHGHGGHIRM